MSMTDAQMMNQEYAESPRNRWALLVGVNTYTEPNFSPLKFCVNDVLALEQILKKLDYTVICLHDDQQNSAYFPTRDNVEEELIRVCKTAQENDLLFVHFACHGKLLEQKPILITQDIRYNLMAKRALSISDIEGYMRRSKANQLVLSLDACHTGVDVGRDVTDPEFLHNVYDLATGFALIAASTSQQKAQEWQEKQHGVYTYYLLEGLQGGADRFNRKVITVRDLQEYVTDKLKRWAIQEGGLIQEPTIRMEGVGDMILADYRQVPRLNSITTSPTTTPSSTISLRDTEAPFTNSSEQEGVMLNSQSNQSYIQNLLTFNFEFITINTYGEVINRQTGQAEYFTESLGEDAQLDMVFVPGGHFIMGTSDATEKNENPPHKVFIQPFFLGKHQVTQAQWRAVSLLAKVNCELNPNPSFFKGNNRPVENITWHEAIEFCQRLSVHTGREYRLPTEAEWEYACRAGTNTSFNCGETLIPELANFLSNQTYETLEKGKYIGRTTNVMNFPSNAFGLYDMHGNVREWCFDCWNDNYQGAPSDGKAWLRNGNNLFRVLRGGSWSLMMKDCRSSNRHKDLPGSKSNSSGFRIALSFD
jgi:formylglycine-generating enzyme required for sulfatase activity